MSPDEIESELEGKEIDELIISEGYEQKHSLNGIIFKDESRIMLSGHPFIDTTDVSVEYKSKCDL